MRRGVGLLLRGLAFGLGAVGAGLLMLAGWLEGAGDRLSERGRV